MGEPLCTSGPTAPSQRILKRPDKLKAQLLAGFADTVAEQTQRNLSQEKPVPQEMRVWKRGREKFILDVGSLETWQAQILTTNLSSSKMDI